MSHPEIYAREYYQRLFDLEEQHWWHLGMRKIAAALLPSQSGTWQDVRVLDVGCGTGGSMMWVQDLLGAKTVIGADIARQALEFCRSRPGLLLAQASALDLPFCSGFFDLLFCHDVLQHLPTDGSDLRALAEAYRVLRPGGFLLVRTNSRLGMGQADTARDADFQRYTLSEVVSLVRAAGFMVQRATYANALPALYASLKRWVERRFQRSHHQQRLYEGLRIRDTASERAWLHWLLLWIMKAEAWYLGAPGRRLAFGHSTFCLGVKPPDGPVARPAEVGADMAQDMRRRRAYDGGKKSQTS